MSIFRSVFYFAFFALMFTTACILHAQNFDLKYELEDILRVDGKREASDFNEWTEKARPRILKAMDTLYGPEPDSRNFKITHLILERSDSALNGLAKRVQLRIKIFQAQKILGLRTTFQY